ncbi:branched-chain amino acid transporter [Comamonas serinivorans]|uniref:Branched-chain amino acid transporter n=1 Tax=Comamonas serinivorans TaxID=1082851 RepID=A0A1Y0ESK2_9BURK|nr:AzlD domain-containing protein [Comamonas serinivorans]ARU06390.1 branched-chain amino acid transporter [Comamonas serinivorans]
MSGTDLWTLLVIVGLTATTVIARCFFFLSNKEWPLPAWAGRGLQYAPIAALGAVIAPELAFSGGQFSLSWTDARVWAALAAAAFVFWRKHTGYAMPGAIAVGMAIYLPLHLALGW